MFASKTLAERNSDREPWLLGSVRLPSWFATGNNVDARHDPRPQFQYGKLPANPILVEFRANGGLNVMWRDLPRFPTEDEKDFAARVLHLLSVLREPEPLADWEIELLNSGSGAAS